MIRIAEQVSRAIRILRGNRDESARASHLVVEKDLLMTYETDFQGQAEREKCSQSTFSERKIMSTKTAFKRVALVAAAALAIGGVSAVSANAVSAIVSDSITAAGSATASSSAIAGVSGSATVDLTYSGISTAYTTDTATLSGTVVSSPITSSASGVLFAATSGATDVNVSSTGATIVPTANGRFTSYVTASFSPDVAGTYVIKIASAGGLNNGYVTWTITVANKVAVNAAVANGSTPILAPANGALGDTNAALAPVSTGSIVANIEFVESNGVTGSGALTDANSKLLTVTVSGPGLASFAYTGSAPIVNPGKYVTEDGVTNGTGNTLSGVSSGTCGWSCGVIGSGFLHKIVYIWGDGTAGTGTVTVSAGGVVLVQKPIIFYAQPKNLSVTQSVKILASGATTNGGTTSSTYAVQVSATDTNGTKSVVDPAKVSITSGDSTIVDSVVCATDGTDAALADCSVHTVSTAKSGQKVSLVFNYTNTDTTVVSSSAVSFSVADAAVASYTLSVDSSGGYVPGQLATLTLTGLDASNNPVADSATIGVGALSATLALTASQFTGNATAVTKGTGSITFKTNAPLSAGDVTITFTPTNTAIAAASVTTTVSAGAAGDAANAATDAANEATDAANAATDAANAAADSADAATQAATDAGDKADAALAAVTALSQQVTSLLAKVAALASTIAKIAKKVKA